MKFAKLILRREAIAIAGIILLACLVSLPSLGRTEIDGLDSAHHLMDGYFFLDLFHDHPHAHLEQYALNYYRQYPALGFLFWPPLFPLVLGIFCLVGGAHVLTARICMLFFGLLFAFAFYAILRKRFSPWLSFAAVASAVTLPGIAWSFNQIMLELPTLAMMLVAILAYQHVVDRLDQPTSIRRALGCAVVCAAVIYTKQPAWFLYPVLLFDFLLLHRRYLRKVEIWITLAATAGLCIPLALFLLEFGHADLAQSVGNNTQLIMSSYHSLPRWTLAAWAFYPRLAVKLLNPVVVLLAAAAFPLAVWRPNFFRENALWFGWFGLAYLTFSYYDNRLPRHSTFWWPAWVVLAAAVLDGLVNALPRRTAWAPPLLLLFLLPSSLQQVWTRNYSDYKHVRRAVADTFAHGTPGNVLIFGNDEQVFVALLREDDPKRTVHIVRGNELIKHGLDLDQMCSKFKISTVLVELPASDSLNGHSNLRDLSNQNQFEPMQKHNFLRDGAPYTLLEFHYDGPTADKMALVPLSNHLL